MEHSRSPPVWQSPWIGRADVAEMRVGEARRVFQAVAERAIEPDVRKQSPVSRPARCMNAPRCTPPHRPAARPRSRERTSRAAGTASRRRPSRRRAVNRQRPPPRARSDLRPATPNEPRRKSPLSSNGGESFRSRLPESRRARPIASGRPATGGGSAKRHEVRAAWGRAFLPPPAATAFHEVPHLLLLRGVQAVEEIRCRRNHFGTACLNRRGLVLDQFLRTLLVELGAGEQ
jgi:hypothetical protein